MLTICVGQIFEMTGPERLVASLAILALACGGSYAFVRWLLNGPVQSDPWDEATAAELAEETCTPLCHHCLAPHDEAADFCPECGATVGTCTNLLPYPWLFSVGHVLRIGTSEHFKRSRFIVGGFVFFSLFEYGPFAPVYWFRLLRNLRRPDLPVTPEAPGSTPANPFGDSSGPQA